jgi:hypothetical protein
VEAFEGDQKVVIIGTGGLFHQLEVKCAFRNAMPKKNMVDRLPVASSCAQLTIQCV